MNEIRPLQQTDIERLADLHFPWVTRQETIEKWTRYLKEQVQGTRIACIVEVQGKLMGYGSLLFHSDYPHFRNKNIPEINDVWVYESYRKKGVGASLITHLEQLARQHNYPQIGIGVGLYRDYGAAQRLYFRLGYMPDGEGISYKHLPVAAGNPYPADDDLILWLTKRL